MTSLLEAALAYSARGWPVFPCRPGRKEPLTEHGVKDATTDPAQIREWWTRWPDANIGIATGHPGPDVIDFDTTDGIADYTALTELRQAQVIDGHGDMVRTRSGGLHLYFTGTAQRNGSIRVRHVDFRSTGGYVIAPPSRVDADDKPGGAYERLGRQIEPQTEVDWRIIRDILDPPPPFQQPPRERAALNGSARAGDDFAAQTTWAEILAPHGWTLARELGNGVRYWLRPGKTGHGISASTHDDGGFYVFTTATEFEPEQPYSKFGAWTVLQGFGSDYTAAAAALRSQGYGEQPTIFQQPAGFTGQETGSRVDQLRSKLLTSSDLDNLPDPDPLIDGILYRDSLAWLHGKPGHGKSFIALDWACCISTGLPWQMCGVAQGPVLYIIAEGVSGLRQRVRAWEDHAQITSQVTFLPIAIQLLLLSDLLAITEIASDIHPSLIVFDTQARVTVGADENSAKDMGELVAAVDRIRVASHACILLVHHEARAGENMRGSTALEGAGNTEIRVTKDGSQLRIENPKQKDALTFEPIRLQLQPHLNSAVCLPMDAGSIARVLNDSENKVLSIMRELFGSDPVSNSTLAEATGLANSSYYRAMNSLVSKGMVSKIASGMRTYYQLVELGYSHDSH